MSGLQARIDESVDAPRAARFWLGISRLAIGGRLPKAVMLDVASRAEHIYRASGARRRLHEALMLKAWCLNQAGESDAAEALLPELVRLDGPMWPELHRERLLLQGFIHEVRQRFEQALAVNLELQALLLQVPGATAGLIGCRSHLCNDLNMLGRHEEAITLARSVIARDAGEHSGIKGYLQIYLLHAQLALGRIDDAWQTMRQAMPGWRRDGGVFLASGEVAALLAARGRWLDAARVGAAANAYQRRGNLEHWLQFVRTKARLQALLAAAPCAPADIARWQHEGEALDEAAIAAICLRKEEPLTPMDRLDDSASGRSADGRRPN